VNAGAVSLLQSTPAALTLTQLQQPQTIALQIDDNGSAQPTLLATLNGNTIFNFTDISGSAITAAGRWGFALTRDRQEASSTIKTITVCSAFEIDDTLTGAVVHRDEWFRANFFGATTSSDGNGSLPHNSTDLMCMYRGDIFADGPAGPASYARDAGNNRIYTPSGSSGRVASTCSRIATDPSQQRRSIVIRFAGTQTNQVFGFLYLRGTNVNGNSAACYAIYLKAVLPGPVWTVGIGRGMQDTTPYLGTTVAIADVSGISGVGWNQDITLDLQAINIGAGSPAGGTPQLTFMINSAVPSWTPQGVAGWTETAAGDWVDGSSTAVLSGKEQGFGCNKFDSAVTIYLDNWLEPAISTGTAGGTPPDNLAGISVTSEIAGLTGTMPGPYDWEIATERFYRAASHPYESTHKNRIQQGTRRRRSWIIKADSLTDAEASALISFWDSHKGSQVPFHFAAPDGEVVAAHFKAPQFAVSKQGPGVRSYSELAVEELFAP
jgi:hypothetical protein